MSTIDSSQVEVSPQPATSKRLRRWFRKFMRYVPLLILMFFFVFPLIFMIVTSFKTSNLQIFADLRSIRALLPVGDLSLDSYRAVFANSNFPRYLLNSVFITVTTIILALFVNSMAAYALSRLKWRGQKLLLSVIIATLIIPSQAVVMPLLLLVTRLPTIGAEGFSLGWLDTYQVQIIPFITSAFSIFLFYQFFQDIPKELDEAALVDGASRFQIYYRIIVPISGPVFASVAILTFIAAWNQFLWPIMTIQSDELRPVMVGLLFFFQRDVQWSQVMAYSTLITLPILFFFFAFQSAFVKSVATSGLKG